MAIDARGINRPEPGASSISTAPPVSFNRRDLFVLLILLCLLILALWRYLFVWPTPLIFPSSELGTDLSREIWPLARYVTDTLRRTGQVPLWRPYLLSGAPLIGHPVATVLYPPSWLPLILPLPLALNVNALFHLWWMGVGTYLVLRFQGRRRETALLGALFFSLSPKWLAHLSGGHWPMLAAIAWWPWAWLGFSRYWSTGRVRWVVLLGVALAAQALNHGNYLAISFVCLGVCTFPFAIRQRWLGLRRAVLVWGLAVVLMLGLAAGHLWPLTELLPYTVRTTLTEAESTFASLPPVLLLGALFAPELGFPEWFIFPGIGVVCLAGLGWISAKHSPQRWWVVVAGVGVVMSLGESTPLYGWFYRWLPGFSLFRTPTRWWLLALFASTVLAALGFDQWLNGAIQRSRQTLSWLVGLNLICLSAAVLKIATPTVLPFYVIPSALPLLVMSILLVAGPSRWRWAAVAVLALMDIWWVTGTLIRPEQETALSAADPVAAFLQSRADSGERSFAPYGGVPESTLAAFDLRAADGYDSFQLAAYADLGRKVGNCDYDSYVVAVPPTRASIVAVQACPEFKPNLPLLRLLNIRYVVLLEPTSLSQAELVINDDQRWVYDLGPGLGRAWGVASGVVVSPSQCLEQLSRIDPATQALVEVPLSFTGDPIPLRVLSSESGVDEEVFHIQADVPALLVRSETWAPGWHVTVDGLESEMLRVNCALQGVWAGEGSHLVHFYYAPRSFLWGRWITLATAMGLVGGGIWLRLRSKR